MSIDSNSTTIRPGVSDGLNQVSVTPMMSRSFNETKSLKADILFHSDLAFSRQALIFLIDGPWIKLMSPERIKMMDNQGLSFLKVCHLMTVGLRGTKSNVATLQRG